MERSDGKFYRFACLFALASSLLLSACASLAPSVVVEDEEQPAPVKEAEIVYRPFSTDSLYELLLAEFAGIREQVEPALEIYTIQAHETRDPGVIARAVHIARFLKRTDVIVDLTELWVEVEPDNIDVRRLLAFHLASEGRVVEAFPHGQYLLESGDQEYLQSLAAFAVDSPVEEKQRLLSLYNDLAARYPNQPGLLLGKAMLLRQLQRSDESLETTETLVKLDPDNEAGQLMNAQLLHSMDEKTKAINALQKALKRLPDNKRLRLQYARFLSEEDLAKSRDQIAILSKLYPKDVNILFSLGLAQRELGELDQAKAIFSGMIDQKMRVSDAQFMLGKIAEDADKPEDAVFHYRQVKDGQNLLPAAMRTAELYMEHDNLSAAREYLSSLRAIYPALRENLFQMEAELMMKMDRLNEAYDLLGVAIVEYPESINLRYSRSIVSALQKDMAMVEEDLLFILSLDENNATALNALGYTMLNLSERYDDALAYIQQAAELEPDNPAILDSLGWAYYRLGDLDQAQGYLESAFEAFPDGEVAAHLGEVLWVQGETEKARAVWERALIEKPDDKTLRETIDRLSPGLVDQMLETVNSTTSNRN